MRGHRSSGSSTSILPVSSLIFAVLRLPTETISGNTAFSGGGIFNNNLGGALTLTSVTITANSSTATPAYGSGGGILNNTGGTVNAKNTIIAANSSTNGTSPDFWGTLTSQGY